MFYTSSSQEKKETIKGSGVASFVREAEYQRDGRAVGNAAPAELQRWGGATEVRIREGNATGQERRIDPEDAAYADVQQVILSGLEKKDLVATDGKNGL